MIMLLTMSVWRVCVECVLLVAGLLWTLAGWGCTPVVHEQSWHPG